MTVATTRPETLFGDVAIAVNPKVGAFYVIYMNSLNYYIRMQIKFFLD